MSEVKRFYIMGNAVIPLLEDEQTYTPMTNHKTEVHTVELVMASDYDQLKTDNERLGRALYERNNALFVCDVACEALRTQLNEARDLLSHISCFVPGRYEAEIDAWLERNNK